MKPKLRPPLDIPIIKRAPVLSPHALIEPSGEPAKLSVIIDDEYLRLIGAVAVAWAKLENCLNDLAWTIAGKDLASGRADTQDSQITKLLSMVQTAISAHLTHAKFVNERKAITNIIKYVHATKDERNMVIHGTWARLGNMHVVGSLRADTLDPSLVTFEHYPTERLAEIKSYAVDAVQNCKSIIARLEASRHISPESR